MDVLKQFDFCVADIMFRKLSLQMMRDKLAMVETVAGTAL